MKVKDIYNIIEEWSPIGIALENDLVGLQVGNPNNSTQKILVSLDINSDVLEEAEKKNVDLIIAHHPLIFTPLKKVTVDDDYGKLIYRLVENKISVIIAHTNIDFTRGGVSFNLAKKLELKNIKVLKKLEAKLKKIVVFVPSDYTEKVTEAMAVAGAGIIGNYEFCSYRSSGVGTFKGGFDTKPFIGKVGEIEKVEEVRLEMIVPQWKLSKVIEALIKSHPYEEPAYDIYPLENELNFYGAGAVGILEEELAPKKFLQHIKDKLNVDNLRYVLGSQEKIKTVAVCGGSGSRLIPNVLADNIDAFITGDVSYHHFQQAIGKILLVDAGHFNTEVQIVENMVDYLKNKFALLKENIQVIQSINIKNNILNI